jgi:AraC-like DNA-binding protein
MPAGRRRVLYNCCMGPEGEHDAADRVKFGACRLAGAALMHARFTRHAFERHSHDAYSIALTTEGIQTFRCGSARYASAPGELVLFNPDQDHDGAGGTAEGFGYSILYLPSCFVEGSSDRAAGMNPSLAFRSPHVRDAPMAARFAGLVGALSQSGETMRAEETAAAFICALLHRHGETPRISRQPDDPGPARLALARDYIHCYFGQDITVSSLASLAGLSRVHLTRAFTRAFHTTPHVYLNTVRIRRAQDLMRAGMSLSSVALECGFADQSHFSRRFKGSVGVPPGQWLARFGKNEAGRAE